MQGVDIHMAYSEAQKRASKKYNLKAYERIELTVKKGKKDLIKSKASALGLSVNSYINSLIDNDLNN